MAAKEGQVTKRKKGSRPRWLTLDAAGTLIFYEDNTRRRRKGAVIRAGTAKAELGPDPLQQVSGSKHRDSDTSGSCFRLIDKHNAKKHKLLYVLDTPDAPAWVAAINGEPAHDAKAAIAKTMADLQLHETELVEGLRALPLERSDLDLAQFAAMDVCKDMAVDFVTDFAGGMFKAVGTALPFGALAVSLGKAIVARIVQLPNNYKAAESLQVKAGLVVKLGPTLLEFAMRRPSDEALVKAMKKLLGSTFYAFRVVEALHIDEGNFFSKILQFLGASSAAKALKKAEECLNNDTLEASFLTTGALVRDSLAQEDAAAAAAVYTGSAAAFPKVRAVDAEEFWRSNKFGESAPVQQLLDALFLVASAADILPEALVDVSFSDIPKLYLFFATEKLWETTTRARFVAFLKKAESVADALKGYLAEAAKAITAAAAQTKTTAWDSKTDAENWRRTVLHPIDFGSNLDRHLRAYVEGTRQWIIDDIAAWNKLPPNAPQRRLFWLNGTAGLGKSVIAARLVQCYGSAERTAKNPLYIGAYIFCKHDDQARSSPHRILATLAFRLAAQMPVVAAAFDKLLEDDVRRGEMQSAALGELRIKETFELLLGKPLRDALGAVEPGNGRDVVLLLDALDELEAGPGRTKLLELLNEQLPSLPPCVRFIVTSRPETDIQEKLAGLEPYIMKKDDDKQKSDLEVFLRQEAVAKTSLRALPASEQTVALAVMLDATDGVFLAARLLANALQARPEETLTLASVTDMCTAKGEFLVDAFYLDAMQRVDERLRDLTEDNSAALAALRTVLRQTLGVLVATTVPPRLVDLPDLCGGEHTAQGKLTTDGLLGALSLLFGSSSGAGTVRVVEPLHKSVYDFLQDPLRAKEYLVDVDAGHATLALSCLRLLCATGWANLDLSGGTASAATTATTATTAATAATSATAAVPVVGGKAAGRTAAEYARRYSAAHVAECLVRSRRTDESEAAPAEVCASALSEWTETLATVSDSVRGTFWAAVGDKLVQLGRFELAVEVYGWALQVPASAGTSRARVELLASLGDAANRAALFDAAEKALSDAGALLEQLGDTSTAAAGRVWHMLGRVQDSKANFVGALASFDKALHIRRDVLGENNTNTATTYAMMAGTYMAQGLYDKALEFHGIALKIIRTELGDKHVLMGETYANEAETYAAQGNFTQAIENYLKCCAIFRNTVGEMHPDTAMAYNNLGNVYTALGDFKNADKCLSKSMAIFRKTVGEMHPDMAEAHHTRANLHDTRGLYSKALDSHSKSLHIRQTKFGSEHPTTATTYHGMANVFDAQGEFAEALVYFDKCLKVREAALGKDHPDSVDTLNDMARVYTAQGNTAKAREHLEHSLAVRRRVFGDNHPSTAESLHGLASVCENEADNAQALALYDQCLAIRLRVFGERHMDTADTINDKARVLWAMGDTVQAQDLYGKGLSIRLSLFGPNHADTAESFHDIGQLNAAKGDFAKALDFIGKSLEARRATLGGKHPDTAMSCFSQAKVYRAMGDEAKAKEQAGKALAAWREVLGEQHENTVAAVAFLAAA